MKNKEKIVIISVEGEDLAAFYHDVGFENIIVSVPVENFSTVLKKQPLVEIKALVENFVLSLRRYKRQVEGEIFCRRLGVNGDGILNIGRTWFDQSPHHSDPKIDLVLEKQYEVWGVSISAESGDAYLCHGEHEDHILINVNNCMRAFPKKK
jgi:hypothetical protein